MPPVGLINRYRGPVPATSNSTPHPRPRWAWTCSGVALIRSGFTMSMTTTDLRDAALAWPTRLDSWMTEFYADSPLYVLSFRALGLESTVDVVRLGFWSGLLALAVLTAWMVATTGGDQRWRAGRLILLSPIVAVIYVRIGSYDTFTVLAWGIALWLWRSGRRSALFAGGVLLGFQHFEQTMMGVAGLLCAWYALRSDLPTSLRRLSPFWLLPGVVAGKCGLILLFVPKGRTPWVAAGGSNGSCWSGRRRPSSLCRTCCVLSSQDCGSS